MFGDTGLYYDIRCPPVSMEALQESWSVEPKAPKPLARKCGISGVLMPRSDRQLQNAV